MKFEKEDIITIDSENFVIADIEEIEGVKYFFTIKVDEDENLEEEFDVLKECQVDGELKLKTVDDDVLYSSLIEKFVKKLSNNN